MIYRVAMCSLFNQDYRMRTLSHDRINISGGNIDSTYLSSINQLISNPGVS